MLPCLNEAETVGTCVEKAVAAIAANEIDGEVIVADNGSTDGSQDVSRAAGARVVAVERRGYGAALMGGIAEADSRFVLMADADDSYDLAELPRFVEGLREGHELVQGCRLPSGGGVIEPGAMPALHRRIGNPLFSALARRWFRAPIHDVYCGMRGFTKDLYRSLDQRCVGMEFATEMIVKASLQNARFAEVPITLHQDGRVSTRPHLRTMRDGWRTLRFFLIYSPRSLFFVPGLVLMLFGLAGFALAMPGLTIFGATLDAHTLLFSCLAVLCGYQALLFSVFARSFAVTEGLLPPSMRLDKITSHVSLERGLVVGLVLLGAGGILLLAAVNEWRQSEFGGLDYSDTMRIVIPGVTLVAVGFQTVLASFLLSILTVRRT